MRILYMLIPPVFIYHKEDKMTPIFCHLPFSQIRRTMALPDMHIEMDKLRGVKFVVLTQRSVIVNFVQRLVHPTHLSYLYHSSQMSSRKKPPFPYNRSMAHPKSIAPAWRLPFFPHDWHNPHG